MVIKMKYCINCGQLLPDFANFCPMCGQKQFPMEEMPEEDEQVTIDEPVVEDAPVEQEVIEETPIVEDTTVIEEPVEVEETPIEQEVVQEEPVVKETPVVIEEPKKVITKESSDDSMKEKGKVEAQPGALKEEPVVKQQDEPVKVEKDIVKEKDNKFLSILFTILSFASIIAFCGHDYSEDYFHALLGAAGLFGLINLIINIIKKGKRKTPKNKLFYGVMIALSVAVLLSAVILFVNELRYQ